MTTKPDYNTRLLAIARIEDTIQKTEAKRQQIYDLILADIDTDIATAKAAAQQLRDDLKSDTLAYVAGGGDPKDLHSAVTFSKRTKLVYDKPEVLAKALELSTESIIRRKDPELDVRAFEKAFKAGELEWAQVEEVNDPTISIGKLGDFLIVADASKAPESEATP